MAVSDAPAGWIREQALVLLGQQGHAWLLQGASGLGQYELSLLLARSWLCESPAAGGLACGNCPSCHAVDVRTHHDLAVLMPETVLMEEGWPLDEKSQADIDDKKRKPSQEIRIDAMRDVIEFAQRTSARGRGKAVLVHPAERMNAVTANALLKTLEEPPGDVRFVLATSSQASLLPTIRSRCMAYTMRWPAPSEAAGWLAEQGVAPADADRALAASGGRPFDALSMARAGRVANWNGLPRAAARQEVDAFAGLAPRELVATLQKICHDAHSLACGGPTRYFAASDLPSARSVRALGDWWDSLARSARHADHPFKPDLMTEALVSEAARALNSAA